MASSTRLNPETVLIHSGLYKPKGVLWDKAVSIFLSFLCALISSKYPATLCYLHLGQSPQLLFCPAILFSPWAYQSLPALAVASVTSMVTLPPGLECLPRITPHPVFPPLGLCFHSAPRTPEKTFLPLWGDSRLGAGRTRHLCAFGHAPSVRVGRGRALSLRARGRSGASSCELAIGGRFRGAWKQRLEG